MHAVGIALIGAGSWGLTLGRSIARVPEIDLRWICELDPRRRAEAARIAPAARVTGALDEVLADPRVAAALVAVDSPRHHEVGLRVLRADRHALVEKPMALNSADAAELRATAEARGRVLAVGHLLLHHPAVRRARELVAAGALGDPLWLEAARLQPGPPRGGSAWWTLAPHDVSLALHLFDAVPARVSAVGRGDRPGDEWVVWATLHFDDGRLAHIRVARHAPVKTRGFSLVGTRGSLTFDELAPEPLRLHPPAGDGAARGEVVPVDSSDPLTAQFRHFVAGVASGDPRAGNGAHALAVVRVLEAGARSLAAAGTPVEVA